jgi:hypothetical protein
MREREHESTFEKNNATIVSIADFLLLKGAITGRELDSKCMYLHELVYQGFPPLMPVYT